MRALIRYPEPPPVAILKLFAADGARDGEWRVNRSESEQRPEGHPVRPWWYVTPPPWWCYAIGAVAVIATAVWRVLSGGATAGASLFVQSLIWPGLLIGAIVAVVVWLGWTLDLE